MINVKLGRRRQPSVVAFMLAGASGLALAMLAADRRRRGLLRDRVAHVTRSGAKLAQKARRDARHRVTGAAARANRLMRADHPTDEQLVARVRSRIGRVVTHPHAVVVTAHDGAISLAGPVLKSEADALVRSVERVRGVRAVDDQLELHDDGTGVPALQGPGHPHRPPSRRAPRERWTPALRGVASVGGAAGVAFGLANRSALVTTAGALLLARAALDRPLRRIVGLGAGRDAVRFRKTMRIDAPVEMVFAYLSDFESFPRFMDHVEDVKLTGDKRWRWRVRGPAGTSVEWDAELASLVPNELIAWRSSPGSPIEHAGVIRFVSGAGDGSTLLDISLTYNPIAGALGHAVAALFRVDPKTSLDQDMLRLKSLLEEGKATAHGGEIRRDAVEPSPVLEGEPAGTR
jgi:uncharacterized membrane protein